MDGDAVTAASHIWRVRGRQLDVGRRTLVIGILNVTPDSFSDGGEFYDEELAIGHARRLIADGADMLDIGGESTRPGRPETVSAEEETGRVLPVLKAVKREFPDVLISIDTYKANVAQQALAAGADVINDVTALRRSPEISQHIAAAGAGLILMHMLGEPQAMQDNPQYADVVVDIRNFLRERMQFAMGAGVPEACIAIDPGIGFGKSLDHNVQILAGLEYLRLLQRPICVGASRKGFLGKLTGDLPVGEREDATVAAHCAAVLNGASIIRTHDVKRARRAVAIIDAIREKQ